MSTKTFEEADVISFPPSIITFTIKKLPWNSDRETAPLDSLPRHLAM